MLKLLKEFEARGGQITRLGVEESGQAAHSATWPFWTSKPFQARIEQSIRRQDLKRRGKIK